MASEPYGFNTIVETELTADQEPDSNNPLIFKPAGSATPTRRLWDAANPRQAVGEAFDKATRSRTTERRSAISSHVYPHGTGVDPVQWTPQRKVWRFLFP